MIVPDVNLLLFAHNEAAPHHASARGWWEGLMSGNRTVALPWAVILGFIRLATHASVLESPLTPAAALDRVLSWVERPNVLILDPGPRHLTILRDLFEASIVAGSLTTDAHLAALAIEHQCEIHSADSDFARFPGLRWHNPLS
jgi:hypothetical protein